MHTRQSIQGHHAFRRAASKSRFGWTHWRAVHTGFVAVAVLLAATSAWAVPLPVHYALTDLGSLVGGYGSAANDINDSGQITGVAVTASGYDHAFLYSHGRMVDLGALPGGSYSDSVGLGINNQGQVTGFSSTASDFHAFLYSNGRMNDLGTLPGGSESNGDDINDSGQITGSAQVGINQHAFLYSNGRMTDLGTLGGTDSDSHGIAINAQGQITGYSQAGVGGYEYAFLYSNGHMTNLGTPPGDLYSYGADINDRGQVTGYGLNASGNYGDAFLYSDGRMTDLGTLPGDDLSTGMGINDQGQIVGSSGIWYLEPNGERAFLYEDGHMFDLNDLVTDRADFDVLFAADAINDRGQIVGFGSLTNGGFDAFLATPLNMVAVPEPSGFWMLMAGLLGIGLLGMRRRLGYM